MTSNKTSINLIAAVCNGNGIGYENQIPWKITEDLQYFKSLTTDCPVIMGRLTQDSLQKPLSNRTNIVISSDKSNVKEGFYHAKDIVDAINIAKLCNTPNIWVIGGQAIYEAAINYADKLYITEIDQDLKCDKFFPDFSINDFKLHSSNIKDGYSFNVYHNVRLGKEECETKRSFERVVFEEKIKSGQSRIIKAGNLFYSNGVATTHFKDIEVVVDTIFRDDLKCNILYDGNEIYDCNIVVKYYNTVAAPNVSSQEEVKSEEVKSVKKPRKAKKCTGCKTCETKGCKNE